MLLVSSVGGWKKETRRVMFSSFGCCVGLDLAGFQLCDHYRSDVIVSHDSQCRRRSCFLYEPQDGTLVGSSQQLSSGVQWQAAPGDAMVNGWDPVPLELTMPQITCTMQSARLYCKKYQFYKAWFLSSVRDRTHDLPHKRPQISMHQHLQVR